MNKKMRLNHNNEKGFGVIVLILIIVLLVVGFVFGILPRIGKSSVESKITTIDNTKYNYILTFDKTQFMLDDKLIDPKTASMLQVFQNSNGEKVALVVIENPSNTSFSNWCKSSPTIDDNDFNGTCDFSKLTFEEVSQNGLTWEKITSDAAKYIPSGHVRYAIAKNNFLYFLVDTSKDGYLSAILLKNITIR